MKTITAKDYIGIGYFIKCRRIALGICKDEFCEEMSIDIETLQRWESEYLENIGLGEIIKLARILNYYPKIFIDGLPIEAYEDWNNFINQDYINYGRYNFADAY